MVEVAEEPQIVTVSLISFRIHWFFSIYFDIIGCVKFVYGYSFPPWLYLQACAERETCEKIQSFADFFTIKSE